MKFKTKEDLMKESKREFGSDFTDLYDGGSKYGIKISFESFAERVEFYKKHRKGALLLDDELYEDYWLWLSDNTLMASSRNYNDWLFDYCFRDVVE